MFKDYYNILGIPQTATLLEIKRAYREMSKKWHPDMHPNEDVKEKMIDINEAYKILSDENLRCRYDKEYERFYNLRNSELNYTNKDSSYVVNDEVLKNEMNDARQFATDLVEEFVNGLKDAAQNATKGAWENSRDYLIGGIIVSIIITLISMCN